MPDEQTKTVLPQENRFELAEGIYDEGAHLGALKIQFCPASAMFSAWSLIRSRSVSAST